MGEPVIEYTGDLIGVDVHCTSGYHVNISITPFQSGLDSGTCAIHAFSGSSAARFTRDSCQPNAKFREMRCGMRRRLIALVPLIHTRRREGLLVDYGKAWCTETDNCPYDEKDCKHRNPVVDAAATERGQAPLAPKDANKQMPKQLVLPTPVKTKQSTLTSFFTATPTVAKRTQSPDDEESEGRKKVAAAQEDAPQFNMYLVPGDKYKQLRLDFSSSAPEARDEYLDRLDPALLASMDIITDEDGTRRKADRF